MLGHVSEILAGGNRGTYNKHWNLDRRQRVRVQVPSAIIFSDFVCGAS